MTLQPLAVFLCGLLLCASSTSWAQFGGEEAEWKEADLSPPPAFDAGKIVTFEVSPYSSLVYGVDPASITISKSDGVVRYVMVARNASGASNVLYEGIRCATGEFKTYARYAPDGRWTMLENPQWRSLHDPMPSKHVLRFAKAGACDGAAPPSSVQALVDRLKNTGR
jgi:hypothetical protein